MRIACYQFSISVDGDTIIYSITRPTMGDLLGWVGFIERIGVMGAFCVALFHFMAKYVFPTFMGEIKANREMLIKQVETCNTRDDETRKQFTLVIERQQDLNQQSIDRLKDISHAIEKQATSIDNLARRIEFWDSGGNHGGRPRKGD